MNRLILAAGAAAAALWASGAQAGTLWIARMNGASENPPNASTFTGTGFLVLNDSETSGTVTATHNITLPLTGSHIHRGVAAVNGPIIFGFVGQQSPLGPFVWAIPGAELNNLKNLGLYMNLHTAVNPGGVIRGTLVRALLAPAAAGASQRAVANALDVSAGYNSELDQVLMTAAVASPSAQSQALEDLSAGAIHVQGRAVQETLAGFGESMLRQGSDASVDGPAAFIVVGESFGKRDPLDGQVGSKVTRPAILGGYAFGLGDGFRVGAAFGYADSKDRLSNDRGETQAQTTSVQGFVAKGLGRLQMSAAAGYGWSKLDTSRSLATLGRSAAADFDARGWALAARLSAPLNSEGDLAVTPYVQLDIQEARIDAYAETGAGAIGLSLGERVDRMSAVEAGAELSAALGDDLTATVQVGWRRLLDDGADTVATRLIGSPVAFQTSIQSPGESAGRLGVQVSGKLTPRLSVSGGYSGLFLNDARNQTVEVRLSFAL